MMDEVVRSDKLLNNSDGNPYAAPDGDRSLPFQTKSSAYIRAAARQRLHSAKVAPNVIVEYQNYTDREIAVSRRDGTTFVVTPLYNARGVLGGDEFIVSVTHVMGREEMARSLSILETRRYRDPRETDCWIRAYHAALNNRNMGEVHATVEYVLRYSDIEESGGRCYMPDVDLLVEWMSDRGAIHPFDKTKRDEVTLRSLAPGVGEGSMILMIKAVDNAQHVRRANRYVNIGGEVYLVPVERDLKYQDGIHVVSRAPIVNGKATSDVMTRTYTFDEADKIFGLHRSIEDATNGGSIFESAKQIVEENVTRRRIEEARLRTGQLEQEQALQRMRNDAVIFKAWQDRENSMRRNWLEWFKWAAAMLGVGVTIYGIVTKLKK